MKPPRHLASQAGTIPLTTLWAYEDTPQDGREPIQWLLLTTLPATNLDEGSTLLRYYSYRWRIERFHSTLKSGCKVDDLELQTETRLEKAIAIYATVANRLLYLTYQSRETPEAPATSAFTDDEWKALYVATHKATDVPDKPPTLQTAVIWVARLGGFLARKGDGNPGVKALWRGIGRLDDITAMWKLLGKTRSGSICRGAMS